MNTLTKLYSITAFTCCLLFLSQPLFSFSLWTFSQYMRFLTTWGLTLSMISHALLLIARLTNNTQMISKYTSFLNASSHINLIIMIGYWLTYLINPNMLLGAHALPWSENLFIHAISPCMLLLDTIYISQTVKQINERSTKLSATILLLYTLSTELLLLKTGKVPYFFLRGMKLPQRLSVYTISALAAMGIEKTMHKTKSTTSLSCRFSIFRSNKNIDINKKFGV